MDGTSRNHQFCQCLCSHGCAINLNRRKLLNRDLVNFAVNDDQFGVSAIDRALQSCNFLARQLRVDLGYAMLDGLDRALELLNAIQRSEEHTSELQSPDHLVCRLLLEKKKAKTIRP